MKEKDTRVISVDIQPEYEENFPFDLKDWVRFINESHKYSDISFYFNFWENKKESLDAYVKWLLEKGINKKLINDPNTFIYPKDYGFLTNCYDPFGTDKTVKLVRHMIKYNILFSDEMSKKSIRKIIGYMKGVDLTSDPIFIDKILLKSIAEINCPIVFLGGARFECLKEIELIAMALQKDYSFNYDFVYGVNNLNSSLEEAEKW